MKTITITDENGNSASVMVPDDFGGPFPPAKDVYREIQEIYGRTYWEIMDEVVEQGYRVKVDERTLLPVLEAKTDRLCVWNIFKGDSRYKLVGYPNFQTAMRIAVDDPLGIHPIVHAYKKTLRELKKIAADAGYAIRYEDGKPAFRVPIYMEHCISVRSCTCYRIGFVDQAMPACLILDPIEEVKKPSPPVVSATKAEIENHYGATFSFIEKEVERQGYTLKYAGLAGTLLVCRMPEPDELCVDFHNLDVKPRTTETFPRLIVNEPKVVYDIQQFYGKTLKEITAILKVKGYEIVYENGKPAFRLPKACERYASRDLYDVFIVSAPQVAVFTKPVLVVKSIKPQEREPETLAEKVQAVYFGVSLETLLDRIASAGYRPVVSERDGGIKFVPPRVNELFWTNDGDRALDATYTWPHGLRRIIVKKVDLA